MKKMIYQATSPRQEVVIRPLPPEKEQAMLYRLISVGYFEGGADYMLRRNGKDDMLVIYTLSGSGYLEYRGKTYEILPGQMFVIDCEEYHAYGTRGPKWQFFWAHFGGAESRSLVHAILRAGGPVYTVENQTPLFDQLFIRADNPGFKSNLLISEMIYGMLIHLLLAAGESRRPTGGVELALRYIEMHLHEEITLEEIAGAAMLSKYHLTREFKKQMGESPYAYLINLRLTLAKQKLLNTDDPVADIAEVCGFSNLSCFFRQFRQSQGCTPLQYRHEQRVNTPLTQVVSAKLGENASL